MNERILAVVPARGGSKGVPLKNLRRVAGVPLVALVGKCVRDVALIDRAVVSTDHDEIARVAEEAGLSTPFRRPPGISGDRIGDWDVIHHALLETERIDGRTFDIVVMLQPTAPLRTPEQVTAAIRHLLDGSWDSVWTVAPTDLKYHPLKALTLRDGKLDLFDSQGSKIIARQQLEPVFHRNGHAYVMTRECIVEQRTIIGRRSSAIVIDGPSVSVDTEDDIARVDRLLRARTEAIS